MQKLSLIQKYELQRNVVKDAEQVMIEKRKEITFNKSYMDEPKPIKPKDKCIGWTFMEYESDYEYEGHIATIPEVEYCPKYEEDCVCKNTKCPGYQKYVDYIAAKKKYEAEDHELMKYPLWVMIAACFKRKFSRNK